MRGLRFEVQRTRQTAVSFFVIVGAKHTYLLRSAYNRQKRTKERNERDGKYEQARFVRGQTQPHCQPDCADDSEKPQEQRCDDRSDTLEHSGYTVGQCDSGADSLTH